MMGKSELAIVLLTSVISLTAHAGGAHAAGRQSHNLWLACENGRNYSIQAKAVSDEGDLVTGYIHLRRHRSVPIRLIPMGEGYRYAGRAIWLDGVAGNAILNWGTRRAVACSVHQG
jgi:hypothetical protein